MDKTKFSYDIEQVKSVFDRNPEVDRVIVTSDGNVFLPKAKGYAANHCKEFKIESMTVLRSSIDNTSEKKSEKSEKPRDTDPLAWRKLSYTKLKEYAETTLGLKVTTLKTKGAAALLEEIDVLMVSTSRQEETPAGTPSEEGTPAEGTTNEVTE